MGTGASKPDTRPSIEMGTTSSKPVNKITSKPLQAIIHNTTPPPQVLNNITTTVVPNPLKNLSNAANTREFRGWMSNHPNYSKKNTARTLQKSLGEGTYGEAILETNESKTVVTKYFTKPTENIIENTGEIAILKYLQGLPHVSQIIKMSAKNSKGRCTVFPCLVMKAEKTSLIDLMRTELEWNTIFQLCIDILQGYNVLHSLGIVHRDTKPDNILITESTNAVITDFGLSVFTLPTIPYNQDGSIGTIWYSSPEVLMRHWLKPYVNYTYTYTDGLAQDAWAVGIVLFYLLTLSDDFFSKTGQQTIDGQLMCILRAKGTITNKDGYIYKLLIQYYNKIYIQFPVDSVDHSKWTELYTIIYHSTPPTPSISQLLEAAIPLDSSCRILIPIVLGLLEYNPTTRFTISQALNNINTSLSSKNKPLIIDTPKSNFDIGNIVAILFTLPPPVDLPASYFEIEKGLTMINTYVDTRTNHILFDRACLFLLQLVHTFKIDNTKVDNYHYTVILLAYALFDCTRNMDTFTNLLEVFTKKQNNIPILPLLKEILLLDVQFLGKTFLDNMLESMMPLTPEKIKRAHEINKYCLDKNVYTKLLQSHTPEKLVTFLGEFANLNASVESINAPPPPVPSVGGNRPQRKQRTPKKPRRSATRRKRVGL
jgi:serine/threonine protein kinase